MNDCAHSMRVPPKSTNLMATPSGSPSMSAMNCQNRLVFFCPGTEAVYACYGMGNKIATFSDHQLECYQDCTYFTRKEILIVFRRFRDLDPNKVPKVMSDDDCTTIRVPQDKLEKMPDLKENPLKERICKVFSSDGSGNMTFDDFLNMCSLFNEQCPRNTKIHYAFQIYDYDGDGFIGIDDLKKTLIALTKNRLTQDEVEIVCSKVLDEADHDNDGQISFLEFKHVVSRSPDFMSNFRMRI